ncbi:MAG: hypothetical protein ABJD11_11115 [Gemmatimonadota bacterium]
MPSPSATPAAAPSAVSLASVAFAYAGNHDAIRLRDPATDQLIATPEWVAKGASNPAAYVRGTRPSVQATFSGKPGSTIHLTVGARSKPGPGLTLTDATLTFDATGHSGPVNLQMETALPGAISSLQLHWDWYSIVGGQETSLGSSAHEILVTLAPLTDPVEWAAHPAPVDPPDQAGMRWTYLPLIRWTTKWATGLQDSKAICDAIIAQVGTTGLKYGIGAWTVRNMLNAGGGFCGGWYRLFQALAGTQGVEVERRSYLVDWPAGAPTTVKWCAIVVQNPGLNRTEPIEGSATYHDADQAPLSKCAVAELTTHRYRFWGLPGKIADGHCINFLKNGDGWILYDSSFFNHGIALTGFTLPSGDDPKTVDLKSQGNLLTAYFQNAVGFMLGSLENSGHSYVTEHPAPGGTVAYTRNGLTVKTQVVFDSGDTIRFYWST